MFLLDKVKWDMTKQEFALILHTGPLIITSASNNAILTLINFIHGALLELHLQWATYQTRLRLKTYSTGHY